MSTSHRQVERRCPHKVRIRLYAPRLEKIDGAVVLWARSRTPGSTTWESALGKPPQIVLTPSCSGLRAPAGFLLAKVH